MFCCSFILKNESVYDCNLYMTENTNRGISSLLRQNSNHPLGLKGVPLLQKGTLNHSLSVSSKMHTYTSTGGVWSGEEVGKWLFLDSLQETRTRHWRGMTDQLVPNSRKPPTGEKSYSETSVLLFS